MKARKSWWLVFAACAAAMGGVMAWITVVVVRLERAEAIARAEMEHEQRVRLALWRMDSWLAPHLARESARPYFEFVPFFSQQRSYTRMLSVIEPGEVVSPSPLLTFQSEYFPLHFQVDASGALTSPQAPAGNMRDLAEASYVGPGVIDRKVAVLEELRAELQPAKLDRCVANAESAAETVLASVAATASLPSPPLPGMTFDDAPVWQQKQKLQQFELSKEDLSRRAQTSNLAQQAYAPDQSFAQTGEVDRGEAVEVGPFVPLWACSDADTDASRLMLVRRVRTHEGTSFQGVLVDWDRLRAAMLEQVEDLLPHAKLVRIAEPEFATRQPGRVLATIPAALEISPPAVEAIGLLSPARTTLAITWMAVAGALLAAALTLRASIAFGERRSRFASAVTHELRTPLTTFRMYSEMLAENMVSDPCQRQVYLDTLRTESNRLSTLVENVLAYARVEEGRAPSRVEALTLGRLVDEVVPPLGERAGRAGMTLALELASPAGTALRVDVPSIRQVLFNLVDNACKYATDGADRTLAVRAAVDRQRLEIRVRDHGPGIAAEHARIIFAPFERGAHGAGDPIPGVGLGLSLCRGLAREMGGELSLARPHDGGACFILCVPQFA
jgi:signal transduction histidine kinase